MVQRVVRDCDNYFLPEGHDQGKEVKPFGVLMGDLEAVTQPGGKKYRSPHFLDMCPCLEDLTVAQLREIAEKRGVRDTAVTAPGAPNFDEAREVGEGDYPCLLCEASYLTSVSVNNHYVRVHGAPPGWMPSRNLIIGACPVCQHPSYGTQGLGKHLGSLVGKDDDHLGARNFADLMVRADASGNRSLKTWRRNMLRQLAAAGLQVSPAGAEGDEEEE